MLNWCQHLGTLKLGKQQLLVEKFACQSRQRGTPVIPAFKTLLREDGEIEASLGCRVENLSQKRKSLVVAFITTKRRRH